ncbi:MAG: ATP-binding protein [Gammaproteobacteria bacterium]|nr:ATP-binding protein [Gammaproteobacteria bacterium]MCW5582513.1 ATP-binding protein [Gammaproteobacteria bacterium]
MNYFPTYLALGEAFCNRKEELKRISYNLKDNTPILLISPRRYGKTSLALKSFEQIKWPYAYIDLYKALSEEDIERFILQGIGQLLGKIESAPKKLLHLAGDFFASLQIKVVVEKAGIQLEFNQNKLAATDIILKSLEKLHDLAKKKEKRVILFLDEFQIVGEVTHHHAIEAAIREAAQKSSHIAYVFSGSNRHLMEQMFYDRKRPFYKLCDQIKLDRINSSEYEKYIQRAAQKKWNKKLAQKTLDIIFSLTELHPYYLNKLCSLLWQLEKLPTENESSMIWQQFVFENKSTVERELDLLSINQRKLLIFLATNKKTDELFSKKMTKIMNLTSSSVQRAIEPLLEKDYVFIDPNKFYRILDPLIKAVLSSESFSIK